jgi:hypothetical protein
MSCPQSIRNPIDFSPFICELKTTAWTNAERHASGAGNSRSDAGAEAISSRLQALDND